MFDKLVEEFSLLDEVESIALGGSRASFMYDEKSDYDLYIYVNKSISDEKRLEILKKILFEN